MAKLLNVIPMNSSKNVGGKKKRRPKKKHGASGGAYSAPLGRGERSQAMPPSDDRFNHSSLKHAVDSLLSDLKQAQKTLNSQGPAIVRKLAEEFGKEFGIHIDSYLAKVESEASHDIGRCWPVSLVYNASVISLCNNILDPYVDVTS
uniref:Uncharacterized protein n=1 Tax=Rhodnius prolixus TaxID=13249 RepID=T1HW48_RHOPR